LQYQNIATWVLSNFKKPLSIGHEYSKYKVNRFKFIKKINHVKGVRYIKGLPIRNQRTHTNAKTSKKKIAI
jgi:ribosomal protein S13